MQDYNTKQRFNCIRASNPPLDPGGTSFSPSHEPPPLRAVCPPLPGASGQSRAYLHSPQFFVKDVKSERIKSVNLERNVRWKNWWTDTEAFHRTRVSWAAGVGSTAACSGTSGRCLPSSPGAGTSRSPRGTRSPAGARSQLTSACPAMRASRPARPANGAPPRGRSVSGAWSTFIVPIVYPHVAHSVLTRQEH